MTEAPSTRGRIMAVVATLLIVVSYVFSLFVAFVYDAVWLTVLIPAALGSLALGALIWLLAVVREAKRKGVL